MGSDGDAVRAGLVRILQDAHAGELAAALAYRSHWRSLREPSERAEVRRIEGTEWHHRAVVADMLVELGARPRRHREVAMGTVGRFFGALCFVTGWFGPMYAAGRLEGMNVGQYTAARDATASLGLTSCAARLEAMRLEEDRHERWFGDQVRDHRLLPLARLFLRWESPPVLAMEPGGRV